MDDTEEETIEVKFITKLENKFAIPENPFRIPVNLGRFGLSGVINHVLQLDSPKPFDFLVRDEFLRGTLSEFIAERRIDKESTLVIEYTEALIAPEHISDFHHDDWVSCCVSTIDGHFITGSYDGVIRSWNTSDTKKALSSYKNHTEPITSIALFQEIEAGGSTRFVSGSKDQTIRVWEGDFKKGFSSNYVCKGHTAAVESVSTSPNITSETSKFCSGSWDMLIHIWNIESGDATKKRKTDSNEQTFHLEPIATLKGHNGCVSSVHWNMPGQIISASWDHTIKTWDVESQMNLITLRGDTAVHDLSVNKVNGLFATGHNDRLIRIWDPRKTEGAMVSATLSSHRGWVSSVSWHPESEHLIISGSYDRVVKVWDIRSSIPLHTLTNHKEKVLCVGWNDNNRNQLWSGSADCELSVFEINNNKR